jgi:MerR family copper efflux transcriptional regulator
VDNMRIGQVARASGIGVETIRFYEREGLMESPARSRAGYRHYPPAAVARLRFIHQAKELGFSLREIKELLSLRLSANRSCGEVKARAERKIEDVDRRIAQLKRMKGALTRLTAACAGRGPTSECPILEALESEELS